MLGPHVIYVIENSIESNIFLIRGNLCVVIMIMSIYYYWQLYSSIITVGFGYKLQIHRRLNNSRIQKTF